MYLQKILLTTLSMVGTIEELFCRRNAGALFSRFPILLHRTAYSFSISENGGVQGRDMSCAIKKTLFTIIIFHQQKMIVQPLGLVIFIYLQKVLLTSLIQNLCY